MIFYYDFLVPLVDDFDGIEELSLDFESALAIQSGFTSCVNGLESYTSIELNDASLAGRARLAMLAFQEASALLNASDPETGAALTTALSALYGQPYSPDADPSTLGYDCINQNIERLSLSAFQPF